MKRQDKRLRICDNQPSSRKLATRNSFRLVKEWLEQHDPVEEPSQMEKDYMHIAAQKSAYDLEKIVQAHPQTREVKHCVCSVLKAAGFKMP
jgi:hypothetical protein